jgi:hypothetical protein
MEPISVEEDVPALFETSIYAAIAAGCEKGNILYVDAQTFITTAKARLGADAETTRVVQLYMHNLVSLLLRQVFLCHPWLFS